MTDLHNLYFLRMEAEDLPQVFAPGEAAGIYLNFSDPWPKDRHAKRRLPSKEFLARYDQILAPEGRIELNRQPGSLQIFSGAGPRRPAGLWNSSPGSAP